MADRIELAILENLVTNDEYCRKVLPFIKSEFFTDKIDQHIFSDINDFYNTYNKAPSKSVLKIHLGNAKSLQQAEFDHANEIVASLSTEPETNVDWLVKQTEKFCRDRAVYNAIMTSVKIMDGRDKDHKEEAIPSILSEALAVSFDKNVGHDYYENADDRYEYYHRKSERIPFDLDLMNKITRGGLPKKTLNVVLAGTNVGKSLFLTHCAAAYMKQGFKVLYITLEMSEEEISQRIDCNLMDFELSELHQATKKVFGSKIDELKEKVLGKLVVKEYPTSGAHVGHFQALLDELKMKKNFEPDIVLVDYINICASQRYKPGSNFNSYQAIKTIAEELRAFAVVNNVPVFSATQTNRGGSTDTDVDMTDTSESFGLPMTVDFLFAVMRTEELDKMGQLMIKQLKSRYNDVNYYRRFVIGIDIQKFKLYNVEQSAQSLIKMGKDDDDDAEPVFDKSRFGKAMKERGDTKRKELDFS